MAKASRRLTPEEIARTLDEENVDRPEEETRNYQITGKPEQLDKLEGLLAWAEYLGRIGHSGSAKLSIDGDGSARLKIIRLDDDGEEIELDLPEDFDKEARSSNGPELLVGID